MPTESTAKVWYVAYGSNLSLKRFRCYLVGGRPVGATRTYPGCRDQSPPADVRSLRVPGGLYFAGRSTVWGGGMAFFDPAPSPTPQPTRDATAALGVAARAYLLSRQQLQDVMTQEMHALPADDLAPAGPDPVAALADGRQHALGPGRYETVIRVGTLDSLPLLTFTAPTAVGADLQPPSRPYLETLAAGLREAHDWGRHQVVDYLVDRPGLHPAWSREDLLLL